MGAQAGLVSELKAVCVHSPPSKPKLKLGGGQESISLSKGRLEN